MEHQSPERLSKKDASNISFEEACRAVNGRISEGEAGLMCDNEHGTIEKVDDDRAIVRTSGTTAVVGGSLEVDVGRSREGIPHSMTVRGDDGFVRLRRPIG